MRRLCYLLEGGHLPGPSGCQSSLAGDSVALCGAGMACFAASLWTQPDMLRAGEQALPRIPSVGRGWRSSPGWSWRRVKAAAALGDEKAPCPRAASRLRLAPALAPSLPSQLLLTTRTLVDGAGASEFPEEFRSQELRQVRGGGETRPRRADRAGRWGGSRLAGHWAPAGHGAERRP